MAAELPSLTPAAGAPAAAPPALISRRASTVPTAMPVFDEALLQQRLAAITGDLPSDSPTFWNGVTRQVKQAEAMSAKFADTIKFLKSNYRASAQNPAAAITAGFAAYKQFVHEICPTMGFEDLVDELSASALASQKAEHDTHSAVNSYMQSFFEGELRTAKLKQQQYQVAEEQYLHDARKYFKLRPDSDPAALAKYAGSMATKKPFLDLQRYDIDVALKEMDDRQQVAVLKTLAEAVRIQKECHEESVARMEKCAEKIRALQANASGIQKLVEVTTNQRRNIRRHLEKEAFDTMAHAQTAGPVVTQSVGIRDQLGAAVVKGSATKEGQLWMPHEEKAFVPAYVKIHSGMVSVYKKEERPFHVELLLCSVREPKEENRLHAFQLVTPMERTTLHAPTHEEMQVWIASIQMAISDQLNAQPSKSSGSGSGGSGGSVVPSAAAAAAAAKKAEEDAVRKQQLDELQAVEGNAVCADCSHPGPDWVSINLGILICLECSGVHRAIGVHVTKVRSLTLDKLDAHLVQFLRDVGNTKSNQLVWEQRLYEQHAHAPEAVEAARQAIIKRDGKDSWIRAKYERKEHMSVAAAPSTPAALSAALYDAVTACDLLLAIKLLRMGASVNWPNEADENRAPLHQAVNIGSGSGCELLLQHGASTDLTDVRLWTALHYAAYHEDADCAEMLLLRGANPCLKDYNEQDCADLAPLDTPLHERLLLARGAAEEKQRKADAVKLSSQSQAIDSRTLFLRSASIDSSSAAAAGGHVLSPSAAASMSAMSKSYSNARSEKERSKEDDDGGIFSSIKVGLSRFLARRPSIADVEPLMSKK